MNAKKVVWQNAAPPTRATGAGKSGRELGGGPLKKSKKQETGLKIAERTACQRHGGGYLCFSQGKTEKSIFRRLAKMKKMRRYIMDVFLLENVENLSKVVF